MEKFASKAKGDLDIELTLVGFRGTGNVQLFGGFGRPWFESFPSCSPTWLRNLRIMPVIECQDMTVMR